MSNKRTLECLHQQYLLEELDQQEEREEQQEEIIEFDKSLITENTSLKQDSMPYTLSKSFKTIDMDFDTIVNIINATLNSDLNNKHVEFDNRSSWNVYYEKPQHWSNPIPTQESSSLSSVPTLHIYIDLNINIYQDSLSIINHNEGHKPIYTIEFQYINGNKLLRECFYTLIKNNIESSAFLSSIQPPKLEKTNYKTHKEITLEDNIEVTTITTIKTEIFYKHLHVQKTIEDIWNLYVV